MKAKLKVSQDQTKEFAKKFRNLKAKYDDVAYKLLQARKDQQEYYQQLRYRTQSLKLRSQDINSARSYRKRSRRKRMQSNGSPSSGDLRLDATPMRNMQSTFQANTDLAFSARQRLHLDLGFSKGSEEFKEAPHSKFQHTAVPQSARYIEHEDRKNQAPHREFITSFHAHSKAASTISERPIKLELGRINASSADNKNSARYTASQFQGFSDYRKALGAEELIVPSQETHRILERPAENKLMM